MFWVLAYKKRFDANKVTILDSGKYPYIVRMSTNNGRRGFIEEDTKYLNDGNTLSFGQDTATVFYQENPYFTGDKIKILKPKNKRFCKANAQFFVAAITRAFSRFSWGTSSYSIDIIENQKVKLPVKNNEIDYDYMESFIAELEAERVAELTAYLKISGLDNYVLTDEEEEVISNYDKLDWELFNLEKLFGKSTRGKRLKSADRISGALPFVTAGEADEGISDFIANKVQIFKKNTTTIDMFGSAKYRNYEYGGDDHVAIVHTEKLPMNAAIFVTSAIHKSSHNGQFDYGKNFYAKDADALDIKLPVKNGMPDYKKMSIIISAVHKLVIKEVVQFADAKVVKTKQVINNSDDNFTDIGSDGHLYEHTFTAPQLFVAEEVVKYGKDKT